MAVEIKSGASIDFLNVDPTSNASRGTFYDSLGNLIYDNAPVGSYFANINFTTGTGAATNPFYFFRNPAGSGRTCYVRRIVGQMVWGGTNVAATFYSIDFMRFYSPGDIVTTGTAITPSKKLQTYPASIINSSNLVQKNTVLTITGGTLDTNPFCIFTIPVMAPNVNPFAWNISMEGMGTETLQCAPTQGFLIRVNGTSHTAGIQVTGMVEWDER